MWLQLCSCFFLPLLLVCVDRRIATSSLLVYVDWFAVVCKGCGGDPERARETGAASKFTAAGCNAKYEREDDDGLPMLLPVVLGARRREES